MSNLKNFLRDVGYFGLGAATVIVEAGSKVVKTLVNKGEKTMRDNQDTVDELKRKTKELGEKVKSTVEKATTRPAHPPVNPAQMTPEERAELRRQLDEADLADTQPVAPDAIYHTEEPVPEEEAVSEAEDCSEEAAVTEAETSPAEESALDEAPVPGEEPAPEGVASPESDVPPEASAGEAASATEIPVLVIPEEESPIDPFSRY